MLLKQCLLEEINIKHIKYYHKYKKDFRNNDEYDMLYNLFFFTFITEFHEIINWYNKVNFQTTINKKLSELNANIQMMNKGISLDLKSPHKIYFLRKKFTGKILGTIIIKCYFDVVTNCYVPEISYEIRPSERNKGYGKMLLELFIGQNNLNIDKFSIRIYDDNIPSIKLIKEHKAQKVGESTNYTKKIIHHFRIENNSN